LGSLARNGRSNQLDLFNRRFTMIPFMNNAKINSSNPIINPHFQISAGWLAGMFSALCVASFLILGGAGQGAKDTDLAKRACRSIHLGYESGPAVAFYQEVKVEKTAVGTYFCVCGFNAGYFGIQERQKDKVVIFSVWDPGEQQDPGQVSADQRVKIIHQGSDVRTGRFGNEGTGGQSFYTYDWKPGETYRFLVKAIPQGTRTTFEGWFYLNDKKQWKHLISFQTITDKTKFGGFYSFIEDFQRNYESARQQRRALYGRGWVGTPEGQWVPLEKARFTGDNNPSTTINAGVIDHRFFLQTGGETHQEVPLLTVLNCSAAGEKIPAELQFFNKR
jgi:hypothetical protein